jgi:hypothetical protein
MRKQAESRGGMREPERLQYRDNCAFPVRFPEILGLGEVHPADYESAGYTFRHVSHYYAFSAIFLHI